MFVYKRSVIIKDMSARCHALFQTCAKYRRVMNQKKGEMSEMKGVCNQNEVENCCSFNQIKTVEIMRSETEEEIVLVQVSKFGEISPRKNLLGSIYDGMMEGEEVNEYNFQRMIRGRRFNRSSKVIYYLIFDDPVMVRDSKKINNLLRTFKLVN